VGEEMTFDEAISNLGDTEESVIAKLRELGCKGRRGDPYNCPMYHYLKSNCVDGRLTGTWKVVPSGLRKGIYLDIGCPFPKHVCNALVNFDDGLYSDLVGE
jgi:hypothetical protein